MQHVASNNVASICTGLKLSGEGTPLFGLNGYVLLNKVWGTPPPPNFP